MFDEEKKSEDLTIDMNLVTLSTNYLTFLKTFFIFYGGGGGPFYSNPSAEQKMQEKSWQRSLVLFFNEEKEHWHKKCEERQTLKHYVQLLVAPSNSHQCVILFYIFNMLPDGSCSIMAPTTSISGVPVCVSVDVCF